MVRTIVYLADANRPTENRRYFSWSLDSPRRTAASLTDAGPQAVAESPPFVPFHPSQRRRVARLSVPAFRGPLRASAKNAECDLPLAGLDAGTATQPGEWWSRRWARALGNAQPKAALHSLGEPQVPTEVVKDECASPKGRSESAH